MCKIPMSKTQIDRLGDRLKGGPHTDVDLGLLENYRQSFGAAYEFVLQTIHQYGEFLTGRTKTTPSIVEKLGRESLRLSQMQDIAGCRMVVISILDQDRFTEKLKHSFPNSTVFDRRQKSSHGYRAVHVIVEISGKPIEVQVRTTLQHSWAEVSEKASDLIDPDIKYGGGPQSLRTILQTISDLVSLYEEWNSEFLKSRQYTQLTYNDFVIIKKNLAELAEPNDRAHQEEMRAMELLARRWEPFEEQDKEIQRILEQLPNEIRQKMTRVHNRLVKLGRQKP